MLPFPQAMLRQYGPDVPDHLLKKLVAAFSELREMADEGLIAYPYSTREVVSIVKHLQVRNSVEYVTCVTDKSMCMYIHVDTYVCPYKLVFSILSTS